MFFCIWKGVKSSSYVVWVTVPAPMIFIGIMIIKGLTLDGAPLGIRMYILGHDENDQPPNWGEKLSNRAMWAEAVGQIFFTLSICCGGFTSMSSYNPKDKPIIGDTLTICFGNCFFSFMAGFAVFAVVGYMITSGSAVDAKDGGIGLAYVVFPTAIDLMPGANFWAVMFAGTLFTLGIDSGFALVEAVNTVLHDTKKGHGMPRHYGALLLCVVGAIFSIFFCFNWGFTLFDVVDHYVNVYLMLLMGVFECLGAAWVYEMPAAIAASTKNSVYILFIGFWAPLVILAILSFATFEKYWYWGLIGFVILQIVIVIVSWLLSGLSYKKWHEEVGLYGALRLSRTMTSLSKEKDDKTRHWWETLFDLWFSISLKYITPTMLVFLLASKFVSNIKDAYGGYHAGWQVLGLLFPAVGLALFILCIFICTEKDPYQQDADEALAGKDEGIELEDKTSAVENNN